MSSPSLFDQLTTAYQENGGSLDALVEGAKNILDTANTQHDAGASELKRSSTSGDSWNTDDFAKVSSKFKPMSTQASSQSRKRKARPMKPLETSPVFTLEDHVSPSSVMSEPTEASHSEPEKARVENDDIIFKPVLTSTNTGTPRRRTSSPSRKKRSLMTNPFAIKASDNEEEIFEGFQHHVTDVSNVEHAESISHSTIPKTDTLQDAVIGTDIPHQSTLSTRTHPNASMLKDDAALQRRLQTESSSSSSITSELSQSLNPGLKEEQLLLNSERKHDVDLEEETKNIVDVHVDRPRDVSENAHPMIQAEPWYATAANRNSSVGYKTPLTQSDNQKNQFGDDCVDLRQASAITQHRDYTLRAYQALKTVHVQSVAQPSDIVPESEKIKSNVIDVPEDNTDDSLLSTFQSGDKNHGDALAIMGDAALNEPTNAHHDVPVIDESPVIEMQEATIAAVPRNYDEHVSPLVQDSIVDTPVLHEETTSSHRIEPHLDAPLFMEINPAPPSLVQEKPMSHNPLSHLPAENEDYGAKKDISVTTTNAMDNGTDSNQNVISQNIPPPKPSFVVEIGNVQSPPFVSNKSLQATQPTLPFLFTSTKQNDNLCAVGDSKPSLAMDDTIPNQSNRVSALSRNEDDHPSDAIRSKSSTQPQVDTLADAQERVTKRIPVETTSHRNSNVVLDNTFDITRRVGGLSDKPHYQENVKDVPLNCDEALSLTTNANTNLNQTQVSETVDYNVARHAQAPRVEPTSSSSFTEHQSIMTKSTAPHQAGRRRSQNIHPHDASTASSSALPKPSHVQTQHHDQCDTRATLVQSHKSTTVPLDHERAPPKLHHTTHSGHYNSPNKYITSHLRHLPRTGYATSHSTQSSTRAHHVPLTMSTVSQTPHTSNKNSFQTSTHIPTQPKTFMNTPSNSIHINAQPSSFSNAAQSARPATVKRPTIPPKLNDDNDSSSSDSDTDDDSEDEIEDVASDKPLDANIQPCKHLLVYREAIQDGMKQLEEFDALIQAMTSKKHYTPAEYRIVEHTRATVARKLQADVAQFKKWSTIDAEMRKFHQIALERQQLLNQHQALLQRYPQLYQPFIESQATMFMCLDNVSTGEFTDKPQPTPNKRQSIQQQQQQTKLAHLSNKR